MLQGQRTGDTYEADCDRRRIGEIKLLGQRSPVHGLCHCAYYSRPHSSDPGDLVKKRESRRRRRKLPDDKMGRETMMEGSGLVDAENVSVAVVHYLAPTGILLYFIFASAIPFNRAARAGQSPRASPSNLLKWIFALTILTFV
jgi:hypothetical protein